MEITKWEIVELYINASELVSHKVMTLELFLRISTFCKSILMQTLQYPHSFWEKIDTEFLQLLLLAKQLDQKPRIEVTWYGDIEIDAAADIVANFSDLIPKNEEKRYLSMRLLFNQS